MNSIPRGDSPEKATGVPEFTPPPTRPAPKLTGAAKKALADTTAARAAPTQPISASNPQDILVKTVENLPHYNPKKNAPPPPPGFYIIRETSKASYDAEGNKVSLIEGKFDEKGNRVFCLYEPSYKDLLFITKDGKAYTTESQSLGLELGLEAVLRSFESRVIVKPYTPKVLETEKSIENLLKNMNIPPVKTSEGFYFVLQNKSSTGFNLAYDGDGKITLSTFPLKGEVKLREMATFTNVQDLENKLNELKQQ